MYINPPYPGTVGHMLTQQGKDLFDYLNKTYNVDIALRIFSTGGTYTPHYPGTLSTPITQVL